jgi:hypothetical protein
MYRRGGLAAHQPLHVRLRGGSGPSLSLLRHQHDRRMPSRIFCPTQGWRPARAACGARAQDRRSPGQPWRRWEALLAPKDGATPGQSWRRREVALAPKASYGDIGRTTIRGRGSRIPRAEASGGGREAETSRKEGRKRNRRGIGDEEARERIGGRSLGERRRGMASTPPRKTAADPHGPALPEPTKTTRARPCEAEPPFLAWLTARPWS